MARARRGGELGVELHADEERVPRQLHHLGQVLGRGARRHLVALRLELRHVDVVHLVAVPVALVHVLSINGEGQGIGLDRALLRAQAHGAPELGLLGALLDAAGAVEPLGDERDHRVRRVGVELGAVRAGEAADVARELDRGELHAEADAQIRHAVLARVADRRHLALGAALAEAAGHEDRVHALEAGGPLALDLLGVEVVNVDFGPGVDAGVAQRLVQALVGVLQVDVLADARDVEHLLVQHHRDLVDRVDVPGRDHRLLLHVAEERDLAPLVLRQRPVGAADDGVGLDADLAQLLHRVLRRLGLDLARGGDVRDERQVQVADIVASELEADLPDRLEERQRLDVADCAADLDDRHVRVARAALDERLDLVGDVRDHLDGAAEVVAAPLLLDHRLVDLAGGEVVVAAHLRALETLVVAQVEVGLGPVLGDENLAVLERRHRAGIDVDVRVQLDVGDADAARLEDRSEGRGGDALPQRGNYTACYENILGHLPSACRDVGVYTRLPCRSNAARSSLTSRRRPSASSFSTTARAFSLCALTR